MRPSKAASQVGRPGGLFFLLLFIFSVIGLPGCGRAPEPVSGPLVQRGYLWQRDWTPAVAASLGEARGKLDGVVILGAEIQWVGGKPQVIRASIDWAVLRGWGAPVGLALRVAPFPGPFAGDDATARAIVGTAKRLTQEAAEHGVELTELQVDFDCAQGKLAGYRRWLEALRPAIAPLPLVITALPSWLDEGDFPKLASAAAYYVLQVHSVPTLKESGRASLCDPGLARKWVAKAAALGRPFSVALPTYRCVAGYSPAGKLIGVAMDSVQPRWPPDTRVLEFGTEADEIAALVAEWRAARPAEVRELIWYRIPVATDFYNWRWPTFLAVMAGRKPSHRLEVVQQGDNPVDLMLVNTGEADERWAGGVRVRWRDGVLTTSDALAGWTLQAGEHEVIFQVQRWLRLSPGERCGIGWLRYDQPTTLEFQVEGSRRHGAGLFY